ncbi:secreted ookinete protein, putative [Plasmodium malariae]|uniref:Secreted ookinete protein, putative n=1 Tax=Plasmodium malariae TaxID=5858 RepID=A0A1C3KZB7_PLAMA|nr:secreted ookinete protein, putative [Plasmodium malariae]SBT79621.1 secreted ookinete protein, putative [Plasmodium malariae]SCO93083.1 secreted ookinete protein, putative [Plasmodium malariae]
MNYFVASICLFFWCLVQNNFVLNEKMIPIGPANRSKLKKMVEGDEDFKINIHAPVEDTQEVLESLDSLMRVEEIQRKTDEEEFMNDKQRLLKIHKKRIQDIVTSAFEPLQAFLPNPLQYLIIKDVHSYLKNLKE